VFRGDDAIVIDPGYPTTAEWKRHASILDGRRLTAILLTHAHIDHILGVPILLAEHEVPVLMHPDSAPMLDRAAAMASMFGLPTPDTSFHTKPLPAEGLVEGLILPLEARHTPGHSPGHISLYWRDAGIVFAGDALFRESIGRTDLPGGDMALLTKSIHGQLYSLPPDTRVLPGHGPETTIAHEKRFNPFVRAGS
jgi:hydroxyacylglutathione hydrolase